MSTINIEVFVEKKYTISQEEEDNLLKLQVGFTDTAMINPGCRITINSSNYIPLYTMSLNNASIQIVDQYISKIVTILSKHTIWVQWRNPMNVYQDGVWQQGITNVSIYKNGEIIFLMDGNYFIGRKMEDLDELRKENTGLDNACLSRETDVIEYIDQDNHVYIRQFDTNGNTSFIMNGFVSKDIREEKTNYYLFVTTVQSKRVKK